MIVSAALGVVACGRIGFDGVTDDGGPSSLARQDAPVSGDEGVIEGAATAVEAGLEAAASCSSGPEVDDCQAIPGLGADPVIDGRLDCGPSLAPVIPVAWSGAGVTADSGMTVPDGNSARIAAAWRPGGLYVFVEVTDPDRLPADAGSPAFFGDAVELFVDSDGVYGMPPAYDAPGTSQIVVSAPGSSTAASQRGEIYRNQVDVGKSVGARMAAFPTPTGYVVEAFVVAGDLGLSTWTLTAGQRIGFDIAIDVSFTDAGATGGQGHRMGQYFLHVGAPPDVEPYQDARSFCTPTLGS